LKEGYFLIEGAFWLRQPCIVDLMDPWGIVFRRNKWFILSAETVLL
jgi:hypothetical protein